MNQKECTNVNFSELGILEYSKMHDLESLYGPTGKFIDLQEEHAGKLQKMYELHRIYILDKATKAALTSVDAQTNQYSVKEHNVFDHELPAIRLDNSCHKEAINSCPT